MAIPPENQPQNSLQVPPQNTPLSDREPASGREHNDGGSNDPAQRNRQRIFSKVWWQFFLTLADNIKRIWAEINLIWIYILAIVVGDHQPYILVTDHGVLNDGVEGTGTVSAASDALTISGATGSVADVGKPIVIAGAGTGGENHYTTISAASGASITLATPAVTAVTGAIVVFGTDNHTALQAVFDAHPGASIFFPEGKYISNGTIILSSNSPLRHFDGQVLGVGNKGSEIFFFNAGASTDDDSNMQHGFGAYNRVADPTILASEIAGVQNIVFQGFGICAPDYGAGFFFGNSSACTLTDIRFRSYQVAYFPSTPGACLPRHGVVIDCGINMDIAHCRFDGSTLISHIGIIKSLDTATGHVVYTDPPGSGYFNDSHGISFCGFNGATTFTILDFGTGSFSNRTVKNCYAGGGAKAWFYAGSTGISPRFQDNWTESCEYGIGVFFSIVPGDILGTSIPHSYFQGVPGLPEHFIIDNNQFANCRIIYYSEGNDLSRTSILNNRVNGIYVPGAKWVVGFSSAPNIEFADSNMVVYGGSIHSALSPVVNPYVVMVNDAAYQYTVYPSGRVNPAWTAYILDVTAGGNWLLNGRDLGYGPIAGPLQFVYFIDPVPVGGVITGITIRTITPFTATGLTRMELTIGDGVGGGADERWYTALPYDLIAAASDTNHADFTLCLSPQDLSAGSMFASLSANQNLDANPLTGSVRMEVLWGIG